MATVNQKPTPAQINAAYMGLTFEQPILANAQNGSAYSAGNMINFNIPNVAGGLLTRLELVYNLNVVVATGTTATLNAGAPYSAVSNISVNYGNELIRVHPYVQYVMNQMSGYARATVNENVQYQNSDIEAQIYTAPSVAVGTNNWQFSLDIPLNDVYPEPHGHSVIGALPMDSTGTTIQVALTCAPSFTGSDPLENPVSASGGSVSVSGSFQLIAWYRDYQSMANPASMKYVLNGFPTAQTIRTNDISPLTSGSKQAIYLRNPYPFVRFASLVIDGLQSNKFSTASNLQAYEIDQAQNASSAFFRFDSTTGGLANYYKQTRKQFGRDFDSGVVVFDSSSQNLTDPSLREGNAVLNLTNSGYPAAQIQYQVGSVSSANGITPRVVTYARIINTSGIVMA